MSQRRTKPRRQRTIRIGQDRYLIRGTYNRGELEKHYAAFVEKFVRTKITFKQWLVQYGKVYCRLK